MEVRNQSETSYDVPLEHNRLKVSLRENTWLKIFKDGNMIFASKSSSPNFKISVYPGQLSIQTDGRIVNVSSEDIGANSNLLKRLQDTSESIVLSSDAPDQHVVDGIGEVSADGTSFCTITLEKVSFDGTSLTDDTHNDELFIRTTGGLIMDATGENRIRSLRLQSGQAQFRLVSESSPKVVTVTAFGRSPQRAKAEIQIEFI